MVLDKLLTKLKAEGHKVLIFSQVHKHKIILYWIEKDDKNVRYYSRLSSSERFLLWTIRWICQVRSLYRSNLLEEKKDSSLSINSISQKVTLLYFYCPQEPVDKVSISLQQIQWSSSIVIGIHKEVDLTYIDLS
jgi:hypothetical protein